MEITLKGSEKRLKRFLKSNSLFMKRNKIEIKSEEVQKAPKPTANQVAELIAKCESLEALKQYESDNRQVVVSAYNKKLKEFE